MSDYMKTDTKLLPYLPFPRFLLGADLTQTAKVLYAVLLDDGEECVCPQAISYSLICRWFRAAVLPLDESLCAALLYRENMKKCVLCGGWYIPKSNRAKYCPDCSKQERRRKTRNRVRRHRAGM